jgi:hypothetical protein
MTKNLFTKKNKIVLVSIAVFGTFALFAFPSLASAAVQFQFFGGSTATSSAPDPFAAALNSPLYPLVVTFSPQTASGSYSGTLSAHNTGTKTFIVKSCLILVSGPNGAKFVKNSGTCSISGLTSIASGATATDGWSIFIPSSPIGNWIGTTVLVGTVNGVTEHSEVGYVLVNN